MVQAGRLGRLAKGPDVVHVRRYAARSEPTNEAHPRGNDRRPSIQRRECIGLSDRPWPAADCEAAKRWVKNWCKLKPGFSRKHVNALMGKPTGHDNDSANWVGFGYHLSAFYDEDARVLQLDINDLGMSKKQRAKLKCASTRSAD